VATFNPQLAVWSNSPGANELEAHLLRAFAARFGLDPRAAGGSFTGGGAEANLSALVVALSSAFPRYGEEGLRALPAQPTFYVSEETHRTMEKAAHVAGLGRAAMRVVEVRADLTMDLDDLARRLAEDRAAGLAPFLVVGTAGTTNAGAVDPLPELARVCEQERLWFHVDAAWGGTAALSPKLRGHIAGVERADSLTFDPHKQLSMPLGTGMFLVRRKEALGAAFYVDAAYARQQGDIHEPYTHSMQWSRRFIGLKLFMTLAVEGWDGVARRLEHQSAMADALRAQLPSRGWSVEAPSALPVVCLRDARAGEGAAPGHHDRLAAEVVRRGAVWLTSSRLHGTREVLRACICSYRTGPAELELLLEELEAARGAVSGGAR
jgi:glutamate/tyrosine decarboxylase-like PLP-dependent enzyme